MRVDNEVTTIDESLDIIALGDTAWRVTDRRFATDARGVLARVPLTATPG